MTPEELKALISKKLLRKHYSELTTPEVVAAYQSMDIADKASMVAALSQRNSSAAGKILQRAVDALMKSDADFEADAMMADNSLDQTELERIFG